MANTTDEIKEKLDVVDVLKEYLNLIPAGRNYKALCPFHNEKTPSFIASPERQGWYCFGCGEGGDIFTFVMKYENLEFGEALRILAEKAGVELKQRSPQEYRQFGLLYDINQEAARFFQHQLAKSQKAKKYLSDRKLTNESVKTFSIGWASEKPDALTVHLLDQGFAKDDIIRSGLALKSRRGLIVDRFRARVMFPIHNHSGKVVAFTGRILPGLEEEEGMQAAKYLNSPETPVFKKSRTLYGFFVSKHDIRDKNTAFLVEGQMDAVLSWQVGIKNVVATSGTALTLAHLKPLKRLANTLIVSFDNDNAGLAALERAITLAQSQDFTVRVAPCEKWDDPADVAAESPEELHRMVESAIPAPEFYFARYLPQESVDFSKRENLTSLRNVLSRLKAISSSVERSQWIKELAVRTGVSERVLTEELSQVEEVDNSRKEPQKSSPSSSSSRNLSRWELLSERLLGLAFAKDDMAIAAPAEPFLAPQYVPVYHSLCEGATKSDNEQLDELLHFVILSGEENTGESAEELIDYLEKEFKPRARTEVTRRIKEAERKGDDAALEAALAELKKLTL